MALPEQCGFPSPIFGDKFPYAFSGKQVMFELLNSFAEEYNAAARKFLSDRGANGDRLNQWKDLKVTSAYPTTKQECPSISVILVSEGTPVSYLGQEIETVTITDANGDISFQKVIGETCKDELEVTVSCLSERQRDDIFLWLKQWLLDAIAWALPQLRDNGGVYGIQRMGASDDVIEYQGSQSTPGFQFYAARMMYTVTYDLIVLKDVNQVLSTFNWLAHLGEL